jgi:HAD superfamily hydrolase (TIGR01490 family)
MASNLKLKSVREKSVVAVFDLDGTLTRRDTLFPFLRWVAGTRAFVLRLPLVALILGAMALGLVSRQRAKQMVFFLYLRGMHRAELGLRAESFARERMQGLLRPDAMARVEWHLAQGHRCVVATASPAIYVEQWARLVGFSDVIATQLEFDDRDCATGRIEGANCRGEEKLRRLEERLGELSLYELHGYGDSRADRAFLDRCTEGWYRPFRKPAPAANPQGAKPANALLDFVHLMRPHQWLKNGFVFVGVIFGHAWTAPAMLSALLVAAAFCLAASAVYIVNDYADRERDRLHPKKRNRPLASGRVTPRVALALAVALAAASCALAATVGPIAVAVLAGYAGINLAYSFKLKNVVILDVFVISAGFILRILAGTVAIGIVPSQWLLVCSLFLTLFLGFTKRRSEMLAVGNEFLIHRRALLQYNAALLDKMIAVCAAAALLTYSLYTMSPVTVQLHGTENLVYTIPFVAYGFFRYLYLLHAQHAGTDTSRDLLNDPHLRVSVLAWIAVTAVLIA